MTPNHLLNINYLNFLLIWQTSLFGGGGGVVPLHYLAVLQNVACATPHLLRGGGGGGGLCGLSALELVFEKNMPVSLEQWRASVGAINASGSRALARCVVRPQQGLGEGVFQLFLFLLVACSCAGVWLAVKWTVSLVLLLKGCRRRSTWKQLALLIVSSVGGFFSSTVRPGK